ncbi:MAG: phospholipid carrier-dependent glycosyltransferase [Chloroflexota bacterium]
MVSIEAPERSTAPSDTLAAIRPSLGGSARTALGARVAALAAIFLLAFVARMVAHDVVITADEDNWMRRAGGFTYGLLNGQPGRTYQNGHPGVTTMWIAMLTLGPERMVQYADRVHNQRLVGKVDGFWNALVDARPGFALATALLVTLIAGLAWRLAGPLAGLLTGLVVGLEPFYLAISQLVHMDALLSGCMVASVLAALAGWTRVDEAKGQGQVGRRGWIVASGVLAGLALLSKVPALFLVPFVPALGVGLLLVQRTPRLARLLGLADLVQDASGRGVALCRLVVDLAVWGIVFAVTVMALWPAIWVWGPFEIFGRVAEFTRETGGQPHEQGTFFWGRQTADPGPFFYPVALMFRIAPLTLAGVVLVPLRWRRMSAGHRLLVLTLAGYCLGFLLMMTLGAKKLDRYVLPMFPALGVLAAVGLAAGYRWLRAWLGADSTPIATALVTPRVGAWPAAAGIVVALLALWPALATYPYFLSYYNPLLGGGPAAVRTVMVGNGEGLDQVARWLNARPNAPDLWVISDSFDILQALIVSSGESLRDRVPSNADYVVLYRFQTQIGHSPRVLDEYLNRRTPELVVTINGVDYARVYRGPHLLAQDEIQAAAIAEAGPAPNPDLDADDDDTPASSAVFAGWREQVKPRLRRLRTYATGLLTSSSGATR